MGQQDQEMERGMNDVMHGRGLVQMRMMGLELHLSHRHLAGQMGHVMFGATVGAMPCVVMSMVQEMEHDWFCEEKLMGREMGHEIDDVLWWLGLVGDLQVDQESPRRLGQKKHQEARIDPLR